MNSYAPPNMFGLDNRMTVVLFAGMGGGCDGLEEAGFHVHLAINHDKIAVAVHEKRHPHVRHLRCDVFEVDPRQATRGRGVRVLHASPDCTHFSVAKGGKPVSKRRRSLAWVVIRWAGQVRPETITLENVPEIRTWGPLVAKRCPSTGRVLRLDGSVAAKGERVPVEQQWLVPDPRQKGRIWKAWLKHLKRLGYSFEGRVLVCADYGVPTIRKRFFGVAQCDGRPIVWPERTHAPRDKAKALRLKPWVGAHTIIDWSLPGQSIFDRKKEHAPATKRRIARGIVRYVVERKPFIVPITHTKGGNSTRSTAEPLGTITTAKGGEMMIAAPHITKFRTGSVGSDMLDPLPTFTANSFEKRPGGAVPIGVVSANLVGLAHGETAKGGVQREYSLEEPITAIHAGGGNLALVATHLQRQFGESVGADMADPAPTFTPDGQGKSALVAAFLAQHNNDARRDGGVNPGRALDEPLSALTGAPQQAVVAASMLALRGTNANGRDVREPLAALMANGNHAGVITASLAEMRGRSPAGRDPEEPLAAVSGHGHGHLILAFLQHYFSNGKQSDDLDSPLGALTAKARYGLVTVKVGRLTLYIDDIFMRMLQPEEGAAAHGFKPGALPSSIVIDGKAVRLTKTQKYHLVGNSVPPRMVQLLAECNVRREFAEAAE